MYCTCAVLKKGGWWDMPCIYVHTVNDFWSHDFTCVYVLYIVSCSHSEEAIASQAVHRTQKVWKTEQVYCQEEKKERQQRPKTVAFQENTLTMSLVYMHMFISTLGSHCDASLWILLYLIKLELSFFFTIFSHKNININIQAKFNTKIKRFSSRQDNQILINTHTESSVLLANYR